METIEFLEQPISVSVLLQIPMYHKPLVLPGATHREEISLVFYTYTHTKKELLRSKQLFS